MSSRFVVLGCVSAGVVACNLVPQQQKDNVREEDEGSRCEPRAIALSEHGVSGIIQGQGARTPACSLDESGHVVLDYEVAETCSAPEPYRGCVVARHQDVSRFLAGEGVFEVHLCVENVIEGALSIWFQDPLYARDLDPRGRVNLRMVGQGEPFASSCRRKWFRFDDLGMNPLCTGPSNQDAPHCRGATSDTATEPTDDEAPLRFIDTEIQLVAEWCDASRLAVASEPVVVTLLSLSYFPSDCLCSDDAACVGEGFCLRDYWTDTSCCTCDDSCLGVCSEALVKN